MWLTRTLGISLPLVGAPMAGPGGGALAHAISAAGALGMIGVDHTRSGDWIHAEAAVAAAHGTPYGVGLMAWALPAAPDQLAAVIELKPALVSVSFGDLVEPIERLRAAGILTAAQIGNLDDLDQAHAAGVDLVVARGGEGGGHGRNAMATLPLLQLVLERTPLPVIAAGGIANHRGLAAVLAAGAVGAWAGTAFLGCVEAANSPAARARLFRASETDHGRVFDVAREIPWPREFGGRTLTNPFFDAWAGREDQMDDDARALHREAVAAEDFEVAHLYAGEGVAALSGEVTAAEVVAEFARVGDFTTGVASSTLTA